MNIENLIALDKSDVNKILEIYNFYIKNNKLI